jgi:hypothetical protein
MASIRDPEATGFAAKASEGTTPHRSHRKTSKDQAQMRSHVAQRPRFGIGFRRMVVRAYAHRGRKCRAAGATAPDSRRADIIILNPFISSYVADGLADSYAATSSGRRP